MMDQGLHYAGVPPSQHGVESMYWPSQMLAAQTCHGGWTYAGMGAQDGRGQPPSLPALPAPAAIQMEQRSKHSITGAQGAVTVKG